MPSTPPGGAPIGMVDLLAWIEDWVPAALLGVMLALVAVDAAMRYVLDRPIAGSSEACVALFIWLVFLGGAAVSRRRIHLSITVLLDRLDPRHHRLVQSVIDAGAAALAAVLATYAVDYAWRAQGRTTEMLAIPLAVIYAALPLSFALMALHHLTHAVSAWRTDRDR